MKSSSVGAAVGSRHREPAVLDEKNKRSPEMRFLTNERMVSPSPVRESALGIEPMKSTTPLSVGDIVAYESVSDTGRWLWSIGTILLSRKGGKTELHETTPDGFILLGSWRLVSSPQSREASSEQRSKCALSDESPMTNMRRRQEEIQTDIDALSRDTYVTEVIRSESMADTAREAIRCVGPNFWNDFYAIRHPPPSVRLAVQSVVALLRVDILADTEEDEWKQMLQFLRSQSFDNTLAGESSVCNIDEGHAYLMTEHFLKNPLFTYDQISPGSHIAALLQNWVSSELLSYGARAQLASIDERLDELNREAAQLTTEMRQRENSRVSNDHNGKYGDNVSPEAVKQCMAEKGEITIIRCDEPASATKSAVFCRIILRPTVDSSGLESLVIPRHILRAIRAAALAKGKRIFRDTSSAPRQLSQPTRRMPDEFSKARSPEIQTRRSLRFQSAVSQVDIFLEESLRREQLTVQELESLFRFHVLHTGECHRMWCRVSQPLSPRLSNVSSYSSTEVSKKAETDDVAQQLFDAQVEVARLEGLVSERDAALLVAQQSATPRDRALPNGTPCVSADSADCAESVARERLLSQESQAWFDLLLLEQRVSRHHATAQLVRCQRAEVAQLRSELAVREVCCARASLILRDAAALPPDAPGEAQRHVQRAREALRERRGPPPPPPRAPPSRVAASCPSDSPTRRPGRPPTAPETETLLRDCLAEALRDREVMQDVLLREQAQRKGLEETVQDLQVQMELEKDFPERSESSGFIRSPPPSEHMGQEDKEYEARQELKERTGTTLLQGTLASYSRQLVVLLAEEGRRNVNEEGSFAEKVQLLRECLAEAHGNADKLRSERDAQAEDARMLETYLRSAADALENALFHDERWRPRTTTMDYTSFHSRIFSGTGWTTIVEWTPETLHNVLVSDIAIACHIPEEYVLNVKFSNNDQELKVSCDIRHDESLADSEFNTRFTECNFNQLEKLYLMYNGPQDGAALMEKQVLIREKELRELKRRIACIKNTEL